MLSLFSISLPPYILQHLTSHTLRTSNKQTNHKRLLQHQHYKHSFLIIEYFTMNRHSSDKAAGANSPWQDGDIAFLKSCEYFLPKDQKDLIISGYLHPKATSHPVIILQAGDSRAIVTTVTAFNSGPQTNFRPPWRMRYHQEKRLDDFHAFFGTELPPNSRHAHLKLSDSKAKMNKPQASWVYIKHFFTVPYTVLLSWNKVPQQLRVSDESLVQLRADIEWKYSSQLREARSRLTTCPLAAKSTLTHGTVQPLQAPRCPRAHQSQPRPYRPQQQVHQRPGALAPTTRYSACGPQHTFYEKSPAHQHIARNSRNHAVSANNASTHPAMMHSWRQPIAT